MHSDCISMVLENVYRQLAVFLSILGRTKRVHFSRMEDSQFSTDFENDAQFRCPMAIYLIWNFRRTSISETECYSTVHSRAYFVLNRLTTPHISISIRLMAVRVCMMHVPKRSCADTNYGCVCVPCTYVYFCLNN